MEKVKAHRKRSSESKRENLPTPPPDPTLGLSSGTAMPSPTSAESSQEPFAYSSLETDPFKRLFTYNERESQFLKLLCDSETNSSLNRILHSPVGSGEEGDSNVASSPAPQPLKIEGSDSAFDSPNDFLMLLSRTGPSVAAALSTKGALDQLDRLHDLIKQLLMLQEQNMRMHWQLKNVETLRKLKLMQHSMHKDPEAFLVTAQQDDNSDNDLLDNEIEQNLALLETILAAGNTASSKRSSSKRERSKSVINEEISGFYQSSMSSNQSGRNYPLRRQSAVSDFKPKVSKWTKVKAAFKWEKTSALPTNEIKTSEATMVPVNNEVARYLRVPSVPCVGSSGDSVFSSSSGIVVSGGSGPGTPGENSLASSAEDLTDMIDDSRGARTTKRDSVKSTERLRTYEEEARRSKSLDGDAILDPIRQMDKNKNKSAWSKVKGIVKNHRGSLKSNGSQRRSTKSSNSVGCSREASPCESMEACELQRDRSDSLSSNQTSPSHRNTTPTFLALPSGDNNSCPNSPCGSLPATFSSDDNEWKPECKLGRSGSGDRGVPPLKDSGGSRGSRKSKHIPEIESVPEGVPIDPKHTVKTRKSPPKPLSLRQEALDVEASADLSLSSPGSQKDNSKYSPKRKSYGGDETSAPESPCKAYEFFEGELEDFSSEEISDQNTPHRRASPKTKHLLRQREEIERRYMDLQKKLQREFDAKQQEWERLRPATLMLTNSPINQFFKDDAPASPKREQPSQIVVEENLSPDFKKKLDEWRIKHQPPSKKEPQPGSSKDSPTDPKKKPITDWQLWKTGQIKLEGQGLTQLPNAKDLPEDFQKKLSEWKQMKAANKVPSYSTQCSTASEMSVKRQQTKCTTGATAKKPRATEGEHKGEGLSKLKALVSTDPPKKELVVQTTKGFIKFEGISRKFTRRLFEWEKAKGIGPEASTIALLHPGYAPVVVENAGDVFEAKREKSPGLGRSLSMDSISPNPSAPSISHQPSSLSLNDADELKETASNRRVSSNPELELSVDREEPRAMLVEVEEDIHEVADPIAGGPKVDSASGQSKTEPDHTSRPSSTSSTLLKDSTKLLIRLREQDSVDRDEVRRLKIVLRALIATLPEFVESGSRDSIAFFACMKDLAQETLLYLYRFEDGSLKSAPEILENVHSINSQVADLKKSLHSYMKYASAAVRTDEDIPKISITPAIGAQATSSIQKSNDSLRNMATINVTPTFVCNAVRVNTVDTNRTQTRHFPMSSESDPVPPTSSHSPGSSTQIEGSLAEQADSKKVARNVSNGSRKKTRIKRMGSRQNSKTESDSDDSPPNYVLEVPRKTKRKTSRAKKPSDSTEKLSTVHPQVDDVVYVLKIKPGQKVEQQDKPPVAASTCVSVTEEVLISPKETCVELLENQGSSNSINNCTASVLVKTKRRIFTTVEDESSTNNTASVVSRDVESSSTSDRVDPSKSDSKIITNLPPLPQSPSTQRRMDKNAPTKELSPNIRLMIAKYNQRLSSERSGNSPLSSGSCSPVAWRSPVLDRRVRKQTEKYQESIQLSKSASAGSLRKSLRQLEAAQKSHRRPEGEEEDESGANAPVKVVKSSSTGMIDTGRQGGNNGKVEDEAGDHSDSPKMSFLAYDSLKRRDTLSRIERRETEDSGSGGGRTETLRKERLYKKRTESPQGAGKGGARKVPREKYTRCRSVPGEEMVSDRSQEESCPKRVDGKPPSPRLAVRRKFPEQDSPRSAPTTPVEENKGIVQMSQRALKLKKAKEDFLQSSSASARVDQRQQVWNNRISQISMTSANSADENALLMKSSSAGIINSRTGDGEDSQQESLYESLPRSAMSTSGVVADDETSSRNTSAQSSRFGLSNLASKLRKVKLRRSSKDLSKKPVISRLCRQSLMVDISGEAVKMGSAHNLGQSSSDGGGGGGGESLKKSGSVQAICNRFRKSNERSDELKKSRSLGFLEPDRKGSQ